MGLTITTVFIWTAIVAAVLTGIIVFLHGKESKIVKEYHSLIMTYFQNFCGAFFIFSGAVKAVDPLGTAYKLEQYFAEFESVFAETWMSFIAPLFPWLNNYTVGFSVFVIVLEIMLGVFLILGHARKLTSWTFFLMVAFFTFLTGFTYLTGYVGDGATFFDFGSWGPYVETNMKVTDCGCFGDFLKLVPLTSFKKDLFLLIPAIYFIWKSKDFHELFTLNIQRIIGTVSIVGLFLYCFSNYVWDIPGNDFRPFREGVNIKAQKDAEVNALINVQTLGVELTNRADDNQVVELGYADYLKVYKQYPEKEWVINYIKEEPAVAQTKISEFEISDLTGNEVTDELISDPNYSFMIVSYKLKYDVSKTTKTVTDTLYTVDTVVIYDPVARTEEIQIVRSANGTEQREVSTNVYDFDDDQVAAYVDIVNPMLAQAEKDGYKASAIVKYDSDVMINDFRHETQSSYPFHVADDILLKTIVRSNPGIVLLKNGEIIQKWHYKQLPSYAEIKERFLK